MASSRRARLRVGTSGYDYDHWSGSFYPEDLRRADRLPFYAERFDTVELNGTFYGLPSEKTFLRWRDAATASFLYALKFSRYGTHRKRLKDAAGTIGVYLERARLLGEHLGPILVQLPPRWNADPERLRTFLSEAPTDLRWAVEVRDESWLREDVFEVLRDAGAALVDHDLLGGAIGSHPRVLTAGWTYTRFHGQSYGGSYPHQHLTAVASTMAEELRSGLDVYAYFNNDLGGHAPVDAERLRRYVANALAPS